MLAGDGGGMQPRFEQIPEVLDRERCLLIVVGGTRSKSPGGQRRGSLDERLSGLAQSQIAHHD